MNAEEKSISSKLSRRGFMGMGVTAAATLAALTGREPQLVRAAGPEATADAIVVLWMAGGMAQTETWDPKRYTPFEPGVRTERVLSTFPSIETSVDGLRISQGLERVARVMDRGALIRTFQGGDLGFILHSRHQYHWHTGYIPPQSVAAPHLGAVLSRTLGPRNRDMPAFIDVGQNLEIGAESDALKSFHTAGFLGSEYGPFGIMDPDDASASVQAPPHISADRFGNRYKAYRELVASSPVMQQGSDYQRESLLRSVE